MQDRCSSAASRRRTGSAWPSRSWQATRLGVSPTKVTLVAGHSTHSCHRRARLPRSAAPMESGPERAHDGRRVEGHDTRRLPPPRASPHPALLGCHAQRRLRRRHAHGHITMDTAREPTAARLPVRSLRGRLVAALGSAKPSPTRSTQEAGVEGRWPADSRASGRRRVQGAWLDLRLHPVDPVPDRSMMRRRARRPWRSA